MSTLETLQDLLMEDYALAREQLTPDAPLDSLGVDSLGVVELMFRVEERFGVQIPGDPPADMRTLGDVARFVESLVAAQPPTPAAGHEAPARP